MSYVPPEPRPGAFQGPDTAYDRAEEMLGREEAFAAEQRLAREAEEATGGTPGEKLRRRLRRLLTRDSGSAAG